MHSDNFWARRIQGRSDGRVYRYLYPQKSAQVNFLRGKNDVRTAIQQFYTPKKLLYPPQKKQISGYAPGRIMQNLSILLTFHALQKCLGP